MHCRHSNLTLCTQTLLCTELALSDITLRFPNGLLQLWSTRSPSSDNIFTWNFFCSKGLCLKSSFLMFLGRIHSGGPRYTKKCAGGQFYTFSWAPCVSIQQHRFLNQNFSELRKNQNFSLKIKNVLSLKITPFQGELLTPSELGERSVQNGTLLST